MPLNQIRDAMRAELNKIPREELARRHMSLAGHPDAPERVRRALFDAAVGPERAHAFIARHGAAVADAMIEAITREIGMPEEGLTYLSHRGRSRVTVNLRGGRVSTPLGEGKNVGTEWLIGTRSTRVLVAMDDPTLGALSFADDETVAI